MNKVSKIFIITWVWVLLCLPVSSAFAKRVALVIGNAQYEQLTSLKNPENDARAIAKRLRRYGFTIIRPIQADEDNQNYGAQLNLTLDEMLEAEQVLQEASEGAEIVFLYYAGHGTQLGRNSEAYILPVNVIKPKKKHHLNKLKRQAVKLQDLMNGLVGKNQLTIAVFDACRDIPDLRSVRSAFGGGTQDKRGLSRLSWNDGQIVAYSGAAGQVVEDGRFDNHSPYTHELLSVLDKKPAQEFGDLFRMVQVRVKGTIKQQPEIQIKGVPPKKYYLVKPKPKVATSHQVEEKFLLQEAIAWLDGDDKTRYALAVSQLHWLAKRNNIEALFRLGIAHYIGRGIGRNKVLGCQFIKQARDKGHARAKKEFGELPSCQ